jgi:hypothetical protein
MQVTVEKANRTGICVDDEWLDYSRFYKGPKDLSEGWTGRIRVDGRWIMEIEGAVVRSSANGRVYPAAPAIDQERLLAGISLLCAVIFCGKGAGDGDLESAATKFREWIG